MVPILNIQYKATIQKMLYSANIHDKERILTVSEVLVLVLKIC